MKKESGDRKPNLPTSDRKASGNKTCGSKPSRVIKTLMNRILLGILCGILFGAIDASMVLFGKSPGKSTTAILQAFFSRFALGILAANANFRLHPVVNGAIVGLLISLPEAIAMKSYAGILGTGLVFGALTGLAVKIWIP
ncbi:MAG: hypothetical protein DMG40_03300 [Acidobacteria bacterium]|nr:MAG: hypothetical protein DMG40_03300 [Acidobacteriota bacterium]